MTKLLRSGISRYMKSMAFWIIVAISLILGLIAGAVTDYLGINMLGLLIVIAILISLMIGTEFSDGIVRNKLIMGHSKGKVFLSELLLSMISSTVLFAVCYGAFIVFNFHRCDSMEAGEIAMGAVGLWMMHLSFAAVCTAVCFFIPYNSTMAAIINITLVIVTAIVAQLLYYKFFNEPEYYNAKYDYNFDENGHIVEQVVIEGEPNPKYIPTDSAEYAVLRAAYYLMPCGQLTDYQFALSELWFIDFPDERRLNDLKTAPLYSLMTIGLFTAAGILTFRKKDLK